MRPSVCARLSIGPEALDADGGETLGCFLHARQKAGAAETVNVVGIRHLKKMSELPSLAVLR